MIAASLAAFALGRMAFLVFASLVSLTALAALFNATPFLYRPDARYARADPKRVRWPEALPIRRLSGNDRLLYCIHGFPSTPADFLKVAESAAERGWDLAAPLLPGCGTEPRDLLDTNWEQYLAMARDEWAELRPRYRFACLVGASVGGSLALALAEETCGQAKLAPNAVATIGSPAVLNAFFRHGVVKNPLVYLARSLGTFVPSIGARLPDPNRAGQDGDGDYKGFLGVYPRQTYAIQLGLRSMERRLGKIQCPAIICHDIGDKVIPYANQGIIAQGLGSATVELYTADMADFAHARHNLLMYDSQREKVWNAILDFFERIDGKSGSEKPNGPEER